jgi:hypothetical protein
MITAGTSDLDARGLCAGKVSALCGDFSQKNLRFRILILTWEVRCAVDHASV